MRRSFEEYLERSVEIRKLSMPPGQKAADSRSFYRRFHENFGRIKELLQQNRKVLDREFYLPLRRIQLLDEKTAEELMEFSDALANTRTLEVVDTRLALMIVSGLLPYYQAKECETGAQEDRKRYIHCLYRKLALSYNVAQGFDRGIEVAELCEEYREMTVSCAESGRKWMENISLFASLPTESQQELVTIQLFSATAYERSYYDEKMIREQIAAYKNCLSLFMRKDIQEAAPEIDWEFQIFSVYSYFSAVQEFLYWEKVPQDILDELYKAVQDALDYARNHPDNYRVSPDSLQAALSAIQFYRGEVSFSDMIEEYVQWNQQGDPTQYDRVNMDANLLALIFPIWMFRRHPEEVKNYREFLFGAQKSSFLYIKNARDKGTYETMQRYTGYIIEDYIEIDGTIPFKDYYQNILKATQPTLYVHCRMVGLLSAAILRQAIRSDPEMLVGVWGFRTAEEVSQAAEKMEAYLLEACFYHDIGKFYLLDTINQYSRFLFPEEFLMVQKHTVMGYRLLEKRESTKTFAEAALYHHRWYDEKGGYPNNITFIGNPDAPLYYIITCADCLDAATDNVGRAYSNGKDFSLMLEDIKSNSGRMFSPDIAALFDEPELRKDVEELLNETREVLYREVFDSEN